MKIVIETTENHYKACKEWHKNKMATVEQSLIAYGVPYEERPQSEWIDKGDFYRCSNCNAWDYFDYQEETCPNCGAKMKGGSE